MTDKHKPTIYAVASRAGVSISTVSRVINDSDAVSPPTRERVVKAMEYLQYRPHRTARSLAQQRHRTLAIALPTFTTPFHNEFLKGVRQGLSDVDIDLMLCDLDWNHVHQSVLGFLRRGAVDGLLLVGVEPGDVLVRELQALQAPVIHVGREWPDFDSYFWDHVAGARHAVEHLVEQAHRHVGLITSHVHNETRRDHVRGYRMALDAAGLRFDSLRIRSGYTDKHAGYSEESGYEAMQQLLDMHPPITAVFASSDVQAVGAWKAVRDAGKAVPDDVAIVGYDDLKTSAYLGLSSIDQRIVDVGREAAETCVSRILGMRSPERISMRITPHLNVRTSSRPIGTNEPSGETCTSRATSTTMPTRRVA